MKILYAASDNSNGKIQLARFLQAIRGSPHQIKIAAYKKSSPVGVSIDWTLDCLHNLYQPDLISLENDNLKIYFQQVKYYAPDLIISDLEYFTSYIANLLEITIWQCSSSIINYALLGSQKYNMGAFKFYAHTLSRGTRDNQKYVNLLDNSNGNFVYSHFGDTIEQPVLREGFRWIRPYHQIGKINAPCQHFLVAGLANADRRTLSLMKKFPDSVAFIDCDFGSYPNCQVKDIKNQEEYFCNLRNSPLFLCQGQTSFLADAFYNAKHAFIYPNYQDAEAVINSCVSQHLGLGHIITNSDDTDNKYEDAIFPIYDGEIKYLHEKVNDL